MVWINNIANEFLNIVSNSPYIMGPSKPTYYLSRDNGKTYKFE